MNQVLDNFRLFLAVLVIHWSHCDGIIASIFELTFVA